MRSSLVFTHTDQRVRAYVANARIVSDRVTRWPFAQAA